MTQTTQKFRAVFLAALMVFSVFAGTVAFAGTAAAANFDETDADEQLDSAGPYFQGSVLFLDAAELTAGEGESEAPVESGETLTLRSVDGESTSFETTINPSTDDSGEEYYEIDTSNLDAGQYLLTDTDGNEVNIASSNNQFEIAEQSLSAEFDSDSVNTGQTTTLSVDSNRGSTFDLRVSSDELSATELQSAFVNEEVTTDDGDVIISGVQTNNKDEFDMSFSDAGTYNFTFSVEDTTAEATTSIDVEETDESYSLPNNINVEAGDTVTFPVNMEDSDTADIVIGSESDGYQVTATVTDTDGDGVANVTVNTYNPNVDNNYGVTAGDDDTEVDVDTTEGNDNIGVTGILDTANYDIEVGPENWYTENGAGSSDISTLAVTDASVNGAQTWTAPVNADSDISTEDDVVEAIEDGTITQGSDVAEGDLAVVQVESSGLAGYIASAEEDFAENGAEGETVQEYVFDETNLDLTVEQENPSANREAKTLAPSNVDYVVDDENNNLFLIIDTSDSNLERDGETGLAFESGDQFNVTLDVGQGTDGADSELPEDSVSSTFEVVDRDASLNNVNDDDVVEVVASENSSVEGESSIAPGSEIRVRAQSESGASNTFVETQTVTVGQNGTFNASFDFSDLEQGTNFTLTLNDQDGPGFGSDEETIVYDATIVNGTQGGDDGNVTTTETGTNNTTETATDDTTPTETSTPEETPEETTTGGDGTQQTETDSPGFGVIVALVALLAAALLAVRRDN